MIDQFNSYLQMLLALARAELLQLFRPVIDWYWAHFGQLQYWAEQMDRSDGARRIAIIMCGLYCLSVWVLAYKKHAAIVRGDRQIGNFRRGYFTTLTVQIVPLMVAGFALNDEFIIWTRVVTLLTIVGSYALVSSVDGTFDKRGYKTWTFVLITTCMLVGESWMHDGLARGFVERYQQQISWVVVATMVMFTVRGQWSLAVDLFKHFVAGDHSMKRFRSQVPRFLMLALPIPHYWLAPSGAALVMGHDPILVAHLSGAFGALVVIVLSVIGMLIALMRSTLGFKRKSHEVEA